MKKDDDETEGVPMREETGSAAWERVEEEVKDEILYHKAEQPKVPRATDILEHM